MKPTTSRNFATIEANGIAPEKRIPTANDAYSIADQLRRSNLDREHRWGTVFKAYKRFPPTDYSLLAKQQLTGMSNIPFGQMTFEVDEKKSAYIDMVTDRATASKILTSIGNDKERKEWSEHISLAWDRALWAWQSYFYNIDQDLEQMLLYGKGIELRLDKATWFSTSYKNSQVLIPEDTKANLENLGEMVVMEKYTPLEFWNKFKNSKDNPDTGWNFWACLEALRMHTNSTDFRMTNTQYLESVASGKINFNQFYNVHVHVFIILSKEWDGGISKAVILQNYSPLTNAAKLKTEEQYLDEAGYLFCKTEYFDDWDDILWAFHGAAGSGLWHDIKGHGEDIFPASRQYDITMNKVIDSVGLEMMVPIKGLTADSTAALKQMEWGRHFVLPDGVDFAQRGFKIPIADAINATSVIMQDTYRGMASFNQIKPRAKQTLGEAEMNYQEDAKLSGTELRRYNICQGRWQVGLYKAFVESKSGWTGIEIYRKFEKYLTEKGVPKEAWEWDNIEQMTSNMIAGAGSPANKSISMQRVAELAGAMATTEGQEEAYRDGIAALAGRDNVDAYRPRKKQDIPSEARVIAFENSVLNDPEANPENAIVQPTDNHVEHIRGHFSDTMVGIDRAMQGIQGGTYKAQDAKDSAIICLLKGGHITAHLNMLATDKTKMPLVKQFGQAMQQLKSRTDELISIADKMAESEQQQNPTQDISPEEKQIQLKLAEKQIDLDAKQKANDLKTAITAQKHQQRMELDKEKAATSIAIERAKAAAETKKPIRTKPSSK